MFAIKVENFTMASLSTTKSLDVSTFTTMPLAEKYRVVTNCVSQEERLRFLAIFPTIRSQNTRELATVMRRACRVYARKQIDTIQRQMEVGYGYMPSVQASIKDLEQQLHI